MSDKQIFTPSDIHRYWSPETTVEVLLLVLNDRITVATAKEDLQYLKDNYYASD